MSPCSEAIYDGYFLWRMVIEWDVTWYGQRHNYVVLNLLDSHITIYKLLLRQSLPYRKDSCISQRLPLVLLIALLREE